MSGDQGPIACDFCAREVEPEAWVRGKRASICLRCVGLGVVATLASSQTMARAESLAADQGRCALCDKPTPMPALYATDGETGPAACSTCLHEATGLLTWQRALQVRRQRLLDAARDHSVASLLDEHFSGLASEQVVSTSRTFPGYLRADLYPALATRLADARCIGFHRQYNHETCTYTDLMQRGRDTVMQAPIQFEEVDVGEGQGVRCARGAIWLGCNEGLPFVVVLARAHEFGRAQGWQVEIAVPAGETGSAFSYRVFSGLEAAVQTSGAYRGKVLSLECQARYRGTAPGTIVVHRLGAVLRDEIILPQRTLALLERNVFGFAAQRERLRALGMPVKKGLLLYGPPGTGKTHTIRYLAAALRDHTTLLVTAEQVEHIAEYMALARLLSPAIVVIEDVDLIARDREQVDTPIQESLLNALLNEMDGLREQAEVFFVLTTNRPQTLERALAGRPGRIDQAIEFPLPDDEGRRKLIELYRSGLEVSGALADEAVRRTAGVSAAFIKEMMRRLAQRALERTRGVAQPTSQDLDAALAEMLLEGGSLNAALLGAAEAAARASG